MYISVGVNEIKEALVLTGYGKTVLSLSRLGLFNWGTKKMMGTIPPTGSIKTVCDAGAVGVFVGTGAIGGDSGSGEIYVSRDGGASLTKAGFLLDTNVDKILKVTDELLLAVYKPERAAVFFLRWRRNLVVCVRLDPRADRQYGQKDRQRGLCSHGPCGKPGA